MTLNLACVNMRDPSKYALFLGELLNLCADVVAVQETHVICTADSQLENDFIVFSAYGNHCSAGVSLVVERSLDTNINLVFAINGDRLVVANVVIKSFEFRVVAVYASNIAAERRSFFRQLGPFLDDPKRLVLVVDFNAILEPKIDKAG